MLRQLLRTLVGQRARPELQYVPVRPIPVAQPVRTRSYDRGIVGTLLSLGSASWQKPQSNQLSS